MSTTEQTAEQIEKLLTEHSKKAIEQAKKAVVEEQIRNEKLREALRFFMEDFWFDAAHPTLLSLACQAVGGNPDDTTSIAAAFVVLTGAADVHDDVIDQSLTKGPKETVYGKYGKEIAIIAGNVLWIKGTLMLEEACKVFPDNKRDMILKLAKEAFFDIGSAEAQGANYRGNLDVQPEEYLDLIRTKVSLARASAKIGAIIGNGTLEEIENLGEYGQTLGSLMTIRDEFIDMFEIDELRNRFKNECLPLPILYVFKEPNIKAKILRLLNQAEISENDIEEIVEEVYCSPSVRRLVTYMYQRLLDVKTKLNPKSAELSDLISFTLRDLPVENEKEK